MEISEINSVDTFHGMRDNWSKVLDGVSDNTLFLSWERIAPSIKYLDQGSTLKILIATENDEILGIAPLRKCYRFLNGRKICSVIKGLTDRAPGVLLAKRKAECLNMFLTHLYDQKDWDFLYFNDVPETFSLVNLLKKSPRSIPDFEIQEGDVSPYLMIPDSIEDLFKGLTGNFRHALRNSMKRIERDYGKVELKDYYELGSLEEMMQVFFDIHQKRWISKGEPGAFNTKLNRDLFLHEAKLFSEINCLRLRFLMVNDKPISVFYGFENKQVLYYLMTGFDPAYFAYSPSNLQVLKTVERCIEEDVKELNFYRGYATHKFKWCKTYRRNFTFRFVNRKVYSKTLDLGMHITRKRNIDKILTNIISI